MKSAMTIGELLFLYACERKAGDGISRTRTSVEAGLHVVEEELGAAFRSAFSLIKDPRNYSDSIAARVAEAVAVLGQNR